MTQPLTATERETVRRFEEAPCGLLEDGEAYHVVRVRADGSGAPAGSKRTRPGAVGVAQTLASISGSRYLVIAPSGETLHDTEESP